MSERELRSWRAYLETGSEKEAAAMLCIHVKTVQHHIAMLKAEYGVKTMAQLAVMLERERVA